LALLVASFDRVVLKVNAGIINLSPLQVVAEREVVVQSSSSEDLSHVDIGAAVQCTPDVSEEFFCIQISNLLKDHEYIIKVTHASLKSNATDSITVRTLGG
jgi:hypothetical protein